MAEPTVDELLADLQDVLDGTGRHAGHDRRLIGRCVWCSCGARVQLNGPPPADLTPTTGLPGRARRWQVRLADGFICFVADTKWRAQQVADKHDGAAVEPAPAAG